ncbi:hydroxyacid dehydrogenase, partial [Streptomyces anulatus]
MTAPTALLAMGPGIAEQLFGARQRARLTALVDTDPGLVAHRLTDPAPEVARALAGAELLITCWGAPPLTAEVLAAAPRLRAVVHAAGSVKHHITPACWERGLRVTSAAAAKALPVSEYTLAAILLAGKDVMTAARRYRERRAA